MINRCILVGRLVRDPDSRKAQSGITVTRFTIAIDRIARNGQEKQADFIGCVAFGKTAEFVDQYIKKGFLVGVDGRIQTGSYDDKNGNRVYTTDVICDAVQNYQPRDNTRSAQPTSGNYSAPNQGSYGNSGYSANEPQYTSNTSNDDFSPTLDISSDDLPF